MRRRAELTIHFLPRGIKLHLVAGCYRDHLRAFYCEGPQGEVCTAPIIFSHTVYGLSGHHYSLGCFLLSEPALQKDCVSRSWRLRISSCFVTTEKLQSSVTRLRHRGLYALIYDRFLGAAKGSEVASAGCHCASITLLTKGGHTAQRRIHHPTSSRPCG